MSQRRNKFRNVHGILLLDKPIGASSNQALQQVKRLYNAKKAGHSGSLDPLASGLLIISLGEATKVTSYLLDSDKRYRTVCKLGITTTTGDSEGEIVQEKPVPKLSRTQIDRILSRFIGEIEQIPPMYSALKYKGKRLYQLARSGIEVERKPRLTSIETLQLVAQTPDTLTLDIVCSKGTYIRTLIEDIGKALGCGSHVIELRRTGAGPYQDPHMIGMPKLVHLSTEGYEALDQVLMPIDSALFDRPALKLASDMAYYVRSGQAVLVPGAPSRGYVRLYDEHNDFVGVGVMLDDGRTAPKRLVFL